MIATKHEFMAPADMLEHEREIKAGVLEAVASSPLIGAWLNCDKATRGLVKILIAASGAAITVHAFGACTPTPCDWGTVTGITYAGAVDSTPAVAFTARYKFNFKETVVPATLTLGVSSWKRGTTSPITVNGQTTTRCITGKQ